jgi:hypothetical protein
MNLSIANISTKIPDADFQAAVAAIGQQVTEHFQPEWNIGAALTGTTYALPGKKAPVQKGADAVIYLGDSSEDPTTGVKNALGYHSITNGKIPYGFIYLNICAEAKEAWSTTLSHEVLELLGDPDAAMTVSAPSPKGTGTVYYDLEVCDPTQGDSYKIGNIEVSNFVGKKYFQLSGGSGKTNYLNLRLLPFGVRPGGYYQYEDGKRAHQVFGSKVTDAQKAAKKLMKGIRRNSRREDLLAKRRKKTGK